MNSRKPNAGVPLPSFSAVSVSTGSPVEIGRVSGQWQLIIIYRGKHCGRCKKYLNTPETNATGLAGGGL